jgi:hypothetical protein
MLKYVVQITQNHNIYYFPVGSQLATCVEDAKFYNRLSDAVRTKNRYLKQPSIVRINALLAPPPAGYVSAKVFRVDLVVYQLGEQL